ncbi:MAG: hypothetical protein H6648_00325 [Caldilineae bacterium]|nr:hypothetical protein [Chloroflexota bacterium]MCB9175572.1 hypothetical protein [Caldilineae bacterium]
MDAPPLELHLGAYRRPAEAALAALAGESVIERIWARDHRLWSLEPTEIVDRLGWLDGIDGMPAVVPGYRSLAQGCRADGLREALLLGMGGSSLAPELLSSAFDAEADCLALRILDSTDPAAIRDVEATLDLERCLFVVASKSGTTVETMALARYFFGQLAERRGAEAAARQFLAITDPGSPLEDEARQLGFRAVAHGDPDIGGRYSALSPFGVLPATLLGLDVDRLLEAAATMAASARAEAGRIADGPIALEANPAAVLGACLGSLARLGRDKLTLLLPPRFARLGDWIEQLVAESTGKSGQGILPIVGEAVWPARRYASDRLFVQLVEAQPQPGEDALRDALIGAGQPLIRLRLAEPDALGAQFLLWEMATAVAAWQLRVNPFDQPDVEAAKRQARAAVEAYRAQGRLEQPAPRLVGEDGTAAFGGNLAGRSPAEAFWRFASPGRSVAGGYLAIQAWLPRRPATDEALACLRDAVTLATGQAVTVGYGPRFLHSTGQLHKGDAGRGRFLQLSADPGIEIEIPDAFGARECGLSFGILERAQAAGDAAALEAAGRPLMRLHLAGPPEVAIRRLALQRL